jgi:TPR repeat protein
MSGNQYVSSDEMSREVTEDVIAKAMPPIKVLAAHGSKMAQFTLGEAYYRGWGVEKDLEMAVEWYRKSANQGHAGAQAALGVSYLNGEGVQQDFSEALRWLKQAAHQGEAIGEHVLGKMYSFGIGIPIDRKRGFQLLSRAAERGLDEAQYEVGMIYAEGKAVRLDIPRATHWFCQGASKGHDGCQLQLFLMKESGVNIPKDGVLGRWALEEPDESDNLSELVQEAGSPDHEGGGVSEEYLAMILTIIDNYEVVGRGNTRH